MKANKIFEAAPRVPRLNQKGREYWRKKGKRGVDVMIYTHDDMDGIYSGIVAKKRLQSLGYNIIGYGILNYMDRWKYTQLDPAIINVCVDFANMPKPDDVSLIDIYIDHHGDYTEEEKELYKSAPAIKTKTGSAYEGICRAFGLPADEITLYSIDMIDSAKYSDYEVDWRDILDFSWEKFLQIANKPGQVTIRPFNQSKSVTFGYPIIAKLTFAGAFNQLLKRSDHKTIIEVIDNVQDASIWAIYVAMKKIYPGNNIWSRGVKAGEEGDFVEDRKKVITDMESRTRGDIPYQKIIYTTQQQFMAGNTGYSVDKEGNPVALLKPSGYQILNRLVFVPSGTWANALRIRSILLKDMDNGVVPTDHRIDFILLQYGNTLQVCGFNRLEDMSEENYPVLRDGTQVKNLGEYMTNLLKNFQKYIGYYEPNTEIGQEELTVSGGHIGIGTISNIVGKVDAAKILHATANRERRPNFRADLINQYNGLKFIDLFKNKIISDLSGINNWSISLKWSEDKESTNDQMITDIIKNHRAIKARIEEYVGNLEGRARSAAEREIKKQIKAYLNDLSDEELEQMHIEAMMGYKIMMRPEIRKIGRDIPERETVEESLKYIKRFKSFE